MQTATSTSSQCPPPSSAVMPIQYPTWAPFKQYVMRPPRCLTFYVSFPFFFTFFPFSFDPALYLSLSFMTSHDKARHKTFPSPALGNKWPNKQACNIFVERLRKGWVRNGTKRNGKMTTCSYKNFYLKATVRMFQSLLSAASSPAWWKRSWQCEWVSYNNRKNRRNWQRETVHKMKRQQKVRTWC